MLFREKPYFLSNEEWYYYDRKEHCYKLTDKAPAEAIESYKKAYEALDETRKNHKQWNNS